MTSLALDYEELIALIGGRAGYGRTSASWSTEEAAQVEDVLQSGYRQMLFPPPLPGRHTTHQWSFLTPLDGTSVGPTTGTSVGDSNGSNSITATQSIFSTWFRGATLTFDTSGNSYTLTASSGTGTLTSATIAGETADDTFTLTSAWGYELDSDFAGLLGGVTYRDEQTYIEVLLTSEAVIRKNRQFNDTTGKPQMVATIPVTAGTATQSWAIVMYPTPDDNYRLEYRMMISPSKLAAGKNPFGGPEHIELLLQSCWDKLQALRGGPGTEHQLFLERLQASVALDERHSQANIGYNSDRYSGRVVQPRHDRDDYTVYYNP